MFFFLSKVLDVLFSPLTWSLLLLAVGLFPFKRERMVRLAPRFRWTALGVLYFFSLEGVSNCLASTLESRAVTTMHPEITYDAVIVLGGYVDIDASATSGEPAFNSSIERLMRGYDMVHTGKARAIILTGGSTDAGAQKWSDAEVGAAQIRSWGVSPELIHLVPASRNTHEDALGVLDVANKLGFKRLLLVTSAEHMMRAQACFRAVGLATDTLVADHRTGTSTWSLMPRSHALDVSTRVFREWGGYLVYRLRGYAK